MPVSYSAGVSTISLSSIDGTETVPVYASACVAQAELAGLSGCRATDPTSTPASLSAITLANPGVFTTSAAHGLNLGDRVYIAGVAGTTQVNARTYLINTVPSTTTFTLRTYRCTPGTYRTYDVLNTSGYSAWTSGGTVYRLLDEVIAHNLKFVPNNTGGWLAIDQASTLVLTGSTQFVPQPETSLNANNGGVTVLHYNSTVLVRTTVVRYDMDALAADNGGRFFALRSPVGVNPQIIHDNETRQDWPTSQAEISPAEYRIEGLSVYGRGDSRKWYGGVSRNINGRDTLANLALSGTGELFQAFSTSYTTMTLASLQIAGEYVASNIELVRPSLGVELTTSAPIDPISLRLGRMWLTDPSFNGRWNGTILAPFDVQPGGYCGVRYTNTITTKAGATAIVGATVRRRRTVSTYSMGYELASLSYGAEAVNTYATTNGSGVSTQVLTDAFIGQQVAGTPGAPISGGERYSWSAQVRKYDYATPSNTVYSGRIYGQGGALAPVTEEIQMLAVNDLTLSESAAAALTAIALRPIAPNLLSADTANLETGIGGWPVAGNCAKVQSSTFAAAGSNSLRLTSSAAGTITASTLSGTTRTPITTGRSYAASAAFRSAVSSRSATVAIAWYTNAGALVSTSTGSSVSTSTTGFTTASVVAVAPGTATYAAIVVSVLATGAGGEVHYVDTIALGQTTVVQPWSAGGVFDTATGTVTVSGARTVLEVWQYYRQWIANSANFDAQDTWSYAGGVLDIGAWNVVVDGGQLSGDIITSGTATTSSGGTFAGVAVDASSTTTVLMLTGLVAHSVAVYNHSGVRQAYQSPVSGTYTYYIPSSATGTWSYRITKHGFTSDVSSFAPTGGTLSFQQGTSLDEVVTQTTAASVAAYSVLDTLDKVYDYSSYYQSTSTGIDQLAAATKSGTSLDLDAYDMVVNAGAGSVFAFDGTTITIKATTLSAGTSFTSLATTGDVSTTGGATIAPSVIVTDSTGVTGYLSITGLLTGTTIAVYSGAGIQQDYVASSGTSYTVGIAATATGTWKVVTKKPGYGHYVGTFPADGSTAVASTQVQQMTPQGSVMYAATVDALATVTISGTLDFAYIDIGDGPLGTQAAYDHVERALITTTGMAWLRAGKGGVSIFQGSSGDFLFMTSGWRLRRRLAGDDQATMNAFGLSADSVVVDGTNGPVAFLTSSVSTQVPAWLTQQPLVASTPDSLAWHLDLLLKLSRNKLITDPATGTMTLYGNDGTSIELQGDLWEDVAGTSPFDSSSTQINRRDRLI